MAGSASSGEEIPIAVVGCDWRLASSRYRSMLVLDDAERDDLVAELERSAKVEGFVDLVTCNRTEWIVSGPRPAWAADLLRAHMRERLPGEAGPVEPFAYVGAEAARHLLSLSIGRESFAVGERQIASQLFDALEKARSRGHSSRSLNGLGSVAGRLVRNALREGVIGSASAGIHSLAVRRVKAWLGPAAGGVVAVVGLGAIGRRVRGLLEEDPDVAVVAVNRTVAGGERSRVRSLGELPAVLREVDAAIVATAAPRPIVGPDAFDGWRPSRPLMLLDLGIPSQVGDLDPALGVTVACLDDLCTGACGGPGGQDKVERLVGRALEEFVLLAREREVAGIYDEVRRRHDRFVSEDLGRVVEEHAGDLDAAQRAHLLFHLRGMVLEYTGDIFEAIKGSVRGGRG